MTSTFDDFNLQGLTEEEVSKRLERDGYKSTPYRVDLYSRLSLSLTPLIMVISRFPRAIALLHR